MHQLCSRVTRTFKMRVTIYLVILVQASLNITWLVCRVTKQREGKVFCFFSLLMFHTIVINRYASVSKYVLTKRIQCKCLFYLLGNCPNTASSGFRSVARWNSADFLSIKKKCSRTDGNLIYPFLHSVKSRIKYDRVLATALFITL